MPLPNARVPVVKIAHDPSPEFPLGLSCDVVFETRLALENTRLLKCYTMIDPVRVRTIMLFGAPSSASLLLNFTLFRQSKYGLNAGMVFRSLCHGIHFTQNIIQRY